MEHFTPPGQMHHKAAVYRVFAAGVHRSSPKRFLTG